MAHTVTVVHLGEQILDLGVGSREDLELVEVVHNLLERHPRDRRSPRLEIVAHRFDEEGDGRGQVLVGETLFDVLPGFLEAFIAEDRLAVELAQVLAFRQTLLFVIRHRRAIVVTRTDGWSLFLHQRVRRCLG